MATLRVVNVPDDLKERFKAICKRGGTSMSAAVLDFIKQSVGEEIMHEAVSRFHDRRRRR